jgi:RecA-family ATPase
MTSMRKPPAGDTAKGAGGSTHNNPTASSDTEQAVGFLKRHSEGWLPEWYVQVVAIDPDGAITAMSVHTDRIDELRSFIEQYQGKYGLYFAVNPLRRDPGPKASKADVAALVYHHVDLDPRNHEPLNSEKLRLIAVVEESPIQPSSVVDSGNGLGVFYRLTEPILHDGNTEALERINKRLEQYFSADRCHNLDRIMRLPGTVNLPTASKIAKGRSAVPVPARLLKQNSHTYSLEDFAFLPPVAEKAEAADLGDVDLGAIDEVSLAARYALHQQHDPDLKLLLAGTAPAWSKDKEGSGLDHALALTLFRLGYSRAENFRLLANYEHGKKSRVRDEKYLRTTIDKFYAPKEKEPDAPATATGWQNLTLKDGATSHEDLHKVDPPWAHAIDPICPRGVVTVYGGANGLGKSTDALAQGLHIATGRSYYGMPVIQGRAIFITAEDPRAVVKSRIQAWLAVLPESERAAAERDICKNFFYFGADETSGMRLTVKEFSQCAPSREAIEMLVALAQGAVSLSLETVAMLNAGDEMNTDLMQLALALKEVASRTGAAVLVVHHVAKDARTGKPDAYSLRGGGSLVDAARSVLLMQELLPGQMDDLNITRIDGAPVMGLYHVKASYAPRHPPLYLRRVEGPRFMQVNASEVQGQEHARNRLMQFLQKTENRDGVSVRHLKDNCTKFKIEKREVENVLLKLEELHWVKRVDSTTLGKAGPKHDIWMLDSLL